MNKKPRKLIEYRIRKQQVSKFKIEEFSKFDNEPSIRKRTIYKNLTMDEAEKILYDLEKRLNK